jgi:hypothetical protein
MIMQVKEEMRFWIEKYVKYDINLPNIAPLIKAMMRNSLFEKKEIEAANIKAIDEIIGIEQEITYRNAVAISLKLPRSEKHIVRK